MPKRKNIIWFDNGMYQGGTTHGYDSINIYDPDTEVIAVFKKLSNGQYSRFATTCELTDMERDFFLSSGGNFATESNLKDLEVLPILKNLINTEKTMTSKYKKIRHLELLRRFLDFKKQDKNIYDLYLENRDEYLELSRYQLINQLAFFIKIAYCYFQFIDFFINTKHFNINKTIKNNA